MPQTIDMNGVFAITASVAAHPPATPPQEPDDACKHLIIDGPFAETKEILIG